MYCCKCGNAIAENGNFCGVCGAPVQKLQGKVLNVNKTVSSDAIQGIDLLKACDRLYVIYNKYMGERFPAIDRKGVAWVFTQIDYADAVVQKNEGIGLASKEFSKNEFDEYIKTWPAFGIEKFHLNIGTDQNVLLALNEYSGDISSDVYTGSKLNSNIIRYKQLRSIAENIAATKAADRLYKDIRKQLEDNVFLVPVCYEGDPDYVDDKCLHISKKALPKIKKLYNSNVKFFGEEGYHFADKSESEEYNNKIMHMKTVSSSGKVYIPCFTEINSLHAIFTDKVRIGIFTYEEINANLKSSIVGFDSNLNGVVINPGSTDLIIC